MRNVIWITVLVIGCGRTEPAQPPPAADIRASAIPREAVPPPAPRRMLSFAAGSFDARMHLCEAGTLTLRARSGAREAVRLGAFEIDAEAITCGELDACLAAGACPPIDLFHRACRDGAAFAPIHTAIAYCAWREMRLPTWAEWQRAAGELPTAMPACDLDVSSGRSRCPVTSSTGLVFGYPTLSMGELTSDTDCKLDYSKPTPEPVMSRPLAVILDRPPEFGMALTRESGEFRCARSL